MRYSKLNNLSNRDLKWNSRWICPATHMNNIENNSRKRPLLVRRKSRKTWKDSSNHHQVIDAHRQDIKLSQIQATNYLLLQLLRSILRTVKVLLAQKISNNKNGYWLLVMIFLLSMLKDSWTKLNSSTIKNLNLQVAMQLNNLLLIMYGTHKILPLMRKSNKVRDIPHHTGFACKVVSRRCKRGVEDWSSTCIRKRGNLMNSRKDSNRALPRSLLLSRSLALFN